MEFPKVDTDAMERAFEPARNAIRIVGIVCALLAVFAAGWWLRGVFAAGPPLKTAEPLQPLLSEQSVANLQVVGVALGLIALVVGASLLGEWVW